MRVLHVIPSVAAADGGPARAVVQMVLALQAQGVTADIATTADGRDEKAPGVALDHEGCRTFFFRRQTSFYKISLPLLRWLGNEVSGYDVVHTHALFSFAPWAAGRASRKARVLYIVRPLGVLNRYGMEQRRPWLKTLSFACIERPLLRHAAAIHYTSPVEAAEAGRLGLHTRPAVIPPGMDFEEPLPRSKDALLALHPAAPGRPIVLFLSRIDEKKGLDLLLDAFKEMQSMQPRALLVIAGKGDDALEQRLRSQASALGLQKDVLWTGFMEGRAKQATLAAADVFVLPSQSENFGIALLEAMASGCACVATPGVALAHDAGDAVQLSAPDPHSLATAMGGLLGDPAEAHALGTAAQTCAFARFSSRSTARELIALYTSLLNPP